MLIKHPFALIISISITIAVLIFILFSQYLAEKPAVVSPEQKIERPNYYSNATPSEELPAQNALTTEITPQSEDNLSETTD